MNTEKFLSIAKDILLPLLVALLPFASNIYEYLTESDTHFVYEYKNTRSPVAEWNRFLSRMLSQVESLESIAKDEIPEPILKKIGQEIYKSLPAMLSGIGFHPTERSVVWVANVSGKELRNIKVHFTGCEGLDTYESEPDTLASTTNPPIKEVKGKDKITLRYDKLAPSVERGDSLAYLAYYGADTSNCRPTVEAEVDGKPAVGKNTSIEEYKRTTKLAEYESRRRADLLFKIFLAVSVVYVFIKVRSLEKRVKP